MNKLICTRSTLRYSSLDIVTLQEVAIYILTTTNVEQKAQDTIYYVNSWQNNIIHQITHTNLTVTCPTEPNRPISNDQMKPLTSFNPENEIVEMKKLKSMYKKNTVECTIHAIANAESYAVDLFWDLIARYTTNTADKSNPKHPVQLPLDFYRDMTYIAKQEAEHFLSWHRRLQQLGYPFGTFPLSKGLWQSAGDTSDNLLARLAIINMTHEAKGLDTYAYTLEKFTKANDTISIDILNHNFNEEVYHVATGLKWFQYICSILKREPILEFQTLSKSYFKGKLKPPFNISARNKAGLTEEWYMPLT